MIKFGTELDEVWLFVEDNQFELPVFVSSNTDEIESRFDKSWYNLLNSYRRGQNIIDKYSGKKLRMIPLNKREVEKA